MPEFYRRSFIAAGLTAGVTLSLPARTLPAANANDSINVGLIGCGDRAGGLAKEFSQIEGVNIAGLCDPDQSRVEVMKLDYPKAETWNDLRDLLAADNIDVVVIATCNHWHCLAAIMAMEAGKDVYVEKPLSHSQWEGRQTVAAARRYNRICQLGTQQRSDPMQAEIKKFLHEERALGNITSARVNRYGVRNSIGKRDTPLQIDKGINYDLWLGPAQARPVFRDKLQYDWHWDWNTGSGEMGNWGVHLFDDVRNVVFQDQVALPHKIFGGGGRVVWNDAGETPNVHFVYFDTGSIPVVIGLTNLAADPQAKPVRSPAHPGPGSGYVAYCEGGRLEGQRAQRSPMTTTTGSSRNSRATVATSYTSRISLMPSAAVMRSSSMRTLKSATTARVGATWQTSRFEPDVGFLPMKLAPLKSSLGSSCWKKWKPTRRPTACRSKAVIFDSAPCWSWISKASNLSVQTPSRQISFSNGSTEKDTWFPNWRKRSSRSRSDEKDG